MTKTYPYRILRSQEFTSSGTFVSPADEVFISGCGGGGGGADVHSYFYNGYKYVCGAGGGGGASCFRYPAKVTKGESVTVTIGISGAAGGSNGGTTSFGSYISLPGGNGAVKGSGDQNGTNASTPGIGGGFGGGLANSRPSSYGYIIPGAGGGGTGGDISYVKLISGGISNSGGGGGASFFGAGGAGGTDSVAGGTPTYGGGGGGAYLVGAGAGGAGYIKIEWWEYYNFPEIKSFPARVLKTQEFTSSGTFVSPTDEVFITAVAGGGGGYSSTYAGGGGCSILKYPVFLSVGESITVTIGTSGTVGNKGGTTSFGSYISLEGGYPGVSNAHGKGGGPYGVAGAVASRYDGNIITGSGGSAGLNYIKSFTAASGGATFFSAGPSSGNAGAANTGCGGGVNAAGGSGKLIVEWWEYQ